MNQHGAHPVETSKTDTILKYTKDIDSLDTDSDPVIPPHEQ